MGLRKRISHILIGRIDDEFFVLFEDYVFNRYEIGMGEVQILRGKIYFLVFPFEMDSIKRQL